VLEVSFSSLSQYRLCPKRYYWKYVEQLTPRKASKGLILGKTIHEAFDSYYKGLKDKDIVQFIDDTYKSILHELPPEEQEQCYLDSKTCLGMFVNFPFSQLRFDAIESEKQFTVPLVRGIRFIGRVDGCVEESGENWIREFKTTGEVRSMFENRASVSGQATAYVWGILQAYGISVVGVIYDAIRKPRLLKKQSEDMYEFGQRIYLDYCDPRKQRSYYYRYKTYRTDKDILLWLEDTISTAKTVRKALQCRDFPRNRGNCWVFNQECPYRRICFERKPDPMIIDLLYERGGNDGKERRTTSGTTGKDEALSG